MSRTFLIRPAAEQELTETAAWYEARRGGLGREFLAALDVAFAAIAREPEAWPAWPLRSRFRRFVLPRFPYVVFFSVTEAEVRVVAVAHGKRRPGYWRSRR